MIKIPITGLLSGLLAWGLLSNAAIAADVPLVEKGDKLTFHTNYLFGEEHRVTIPINNANGRGIVYIHLSAEYASGGTNAWADLFIATNSLDDFLGDCDGGEQQTPGAKPSRKRSITVSDEFQYGQFTNKNQAVRYLVYHDKSLKPYQQAFARYAGGPAPARPWRSRWASHTSGFFKWANGVETNLYSNQATVTNTPASTATSAAGAGLTSLAGRRASDEAQFGSQVANSTTPALDEYATNSASANGDYLRDF